MTLIVGLTGGIGSGKSAASQWFETQGINVVDADIAAREIVEKGQPALAQIQSAFGDWVLLESGELNRKALREHIFQHLIPWHRAAATIAGNTDSFHCCMNSIFYIDISQRQGTISR